MVLRGRLISDAAQSAEKSKSDFWRLKKPQRLLPKGHDAFYDYLLENETKYEKDLDYLRTITLFQLKKSSLGAFDHLEEFIEFYSLGNKASTWQFIGDAQAAKINITKTAPKIREWVGAELHRANLIFSDFEQNVNLNAAVEKTILYGYLRSFRKGCIHHLHWSAAFKLNDVLNTVQSYMLDSVNERSAQAPKVKITLILQTELYLEDKTRPESKSYLDIPFPRLLIIDDFLGLMDKLEKNEKNLKPQIAFFKDNYILGDGRCVLNPISSSGEVSIENDLRVYLYFKTCKNSVLYANKEFANEFGKKGFKGIEPLHKLISFAEGQSHVLEEKQNLQSEFLPSSYKDLLYNVKVQLSVAIWFKFEMIFGLYEKLFDNENIFNYLSGKLAKEFFHEKVLGVEFRQGYDIGKPSSRMEIIKKKFKQILGTEEVLVSFIVPGRKVKKGHKLRQVIANLDKARSLNQSEIAGFDFFGYEDDPFSGARNFLPSSLQGFFEDENKDENVNNNKNNSNNNNPNNINNNCKKDNNNSKNSLSNDFEFMLAALRRGHKFFLYAGKHYISQTTLSPSNS